MTPVHLTRPEARRFLVHYHGLDGSASWSGASGVVDCLTRLGAIQYDPLDVVGRNPELVLQSRVEGFRRETLRDLLYRDRLLVDHWDKQMSIHLAVEWPHRRRLRRAYAEALCGWLRHYRNSEEALRHVDVVFAALKATGPTLPGKLDFGSLPNDSGWGSRKVSGTALEYLAACGKVGVHSRKHTQKLYAPIDKLLPEVLLSAPDPFADERDFLRWYARRRVEAVGLAANRNGGSWLVNLLDSKVARTPVLTELAESGELTRVKVDGVREILYMPSTYFSRMEWAGVPERKVRFLAPLDNLLFDRKLIASLFEFEYTWEVYVPAAKRRYGYYVLPVLYGDELVARFEPAPHRGNAGLEIKQWWWEPGVRRTGELERAVADARQRFQAFLDYP